MLEWHNPNAIEMHAPFSLEFDAQLLDVLQIHPLEAARNADNGMCAFLHWSSKV